ncbi:MAG: UDP-N-acetylmuramate--L-alanine ligase [Pseudomonadota bacterium]
MSPSKLIHLVGVGGIGMSAIAEILIRSGYRVSGSDLRTNAETEKLKSLGATIFGSHRAENVPDARAVVYSSAVPPNNPEILEAKRRKIPVIPRAEMLAELMRMKHSIVVAGAHGKTTTSAMIMTILLKAGFDPTAVIGGRLKQISGNAKIGTDEWFVAESDESDGSFLRLLPAVAVITNVDREHLDHYGSYAKLEQAFVDFANRVSFDGIVAICADDPGASAILPMIEKPVVTYGIDKETDLRAVGIELTANGSRFSIVRGEEKFGPVELPIPGRHNIWNALASFAVCRHIGAESGKIVEGLAGFAGIERRLEVKGSVHEIRVVDDYAHHPTEIVATIEALRAIAGTGKVRILFQPHRFTRVGDLWDRFLVAFDGADELFMMPIYAASEKPIVGVDAERLTKEIAQRGKVRAKYVASLEEGITALCQTAAAGDLIATMGAGDVTKAGPLILGLLRRTRK